MLFYWVVLAYAIAMNTFGMRLLPHMNTASGRLNAFFCTTISASNGADTFLGIIHVAAFVAIVIALGVTSKKNSSEFVFTEFVNNSGWKSDGVAWLVGLQSTVYPFLG
jgi:choline transport protein